MFVLLYADSKNVTDSLSSFKWVKLIGNQTSEEELESDGVILKIYKNELSENIPMIRYRFHATYNNTPFSNEIVFSFVTTGRNGVNGYTPQKGVDYFDGVNGQDGKSVTIEGVAYADSTPITGNSITIYSDPTIHNESTIIKATSTGKSYLVDGYLCVPNVEDGHFICTGRIQGPKGEKGDSSYVFVRYADVFDCTHLLEY